MWNSHSFGARLGAGFAAICALLICVVTLAGFQLNASLDAMRNVVEVRDRRVAKVAEMVMLVSDIAVSVRNMALLQTDPELNAEMKTLQTSLTAYDMNRKSLTNLFHGDMSEEEVGVLAAIDKSSTFAPHLVLEAVRLGNEGATPEATVMIVGQVRPVLDNWLRQLEALNAIQRKYSEVAYVASAERQEKAIVILGVSALLCLCISIAVATRITSSISRPLGIALSTAERVAEGDLTSSIEEGHGDEAGRLLTAIAIMQERLRMVVSGIRDATDSIQVAASEIASGNIDLSTRTEQAASNIQHTASSMGEITEMAAQSAESAAAASRLSESAAEIAEQGGIAVSQVVSTMEGISAASRKINEITSVIDAIAFQTNILALNAAVEAARAGEQGRGFAVVASEVRGLAQRSAQAAKEIKVLIQDTVSEVEIGAALVNNAGNTMQEIVASVIHVRQNIAEIARTSIEQTSGIGEVSSAVGNLDRMTQQNAALVEQSAAAAESLKEQAARLVQMVNIFRLNDMSVVANERQYSLR